MGRITVFVLQDCPHCKRAKAALTSRNIPYNEISLDTHPDKRTDMLSLADRLTVPQFFFNEKHVGGADELIATVEVWESKKKSRAAYKYYEKEILNKPDPTDPRLQVPTTPPVVEKLPPPRNNMKTVKMPDGSKATVLQITTELRRILPRETLHHNLSTYKNAFVGRDAVLVFKSHFGITTTEQAVEFGNVLVDSHIIKHVHGDHIFKDEYLFYRLQCFDQPDVLNSFRIWTERVDEDSMSLLKRLKKLLGKIETDVTGNDGLVGYKKAPHHEKWNEFEEAVCELQCVHMQHMGEHMKLAFGINLYNLMIKYAFMKVGIGDTSSARGSFFSGIGMNLGGHMLSFNDLEHGIIRGNAKPAYGLTTQFNPSDPRALLKLDNLDCRIHFALNCGANSCPPVKDFTINAVEEELRIVAQSFCEQDENVRVDEENTTLHLTMLLKWYGADFAPSTKQLPAKVVTFLRGEKKEELQRMIDSGKAISVQFNTYDWGTNASEFVSFEKSSLTTNERGLKAAIC